MAGAESEILGSPSSCDSVNMASADATGLDVDFDIMVLERFQSDLNGISSIVCSR